MDRRTILAGVPAMITAAPLAAATAASAAPAPDRRLNQFKAVIADWKRQDIDAVLARLHDDIVWHFAAAVVPPLRGKAAARAFLEKFSQEVAEVRWRLFHAAEQGDRLFVEGVDEFVRADGRKVAVPYAGIMEFDGDLIIGWRDYIDRSVIEAMRRGEPYPPQVVELIDREAL
ncbi:nuclear transport factor 2 family protein [Niveispirillum fermenti]|uniref:nuclear transport factor 2 family protein n=1 Tax=Niveispirillum fermenti TaxID=1233113 RepID=UPI003A877ABA